MATRINREALRQRIKELAGLSDDERAQLLELVNTKKYGLVWENHPEAVEERLRTHLPVLDEVPERYIPGATADAPNHILIEGDNLEALTALTYTHEGRIDVIYIDPPYNTGNKDFVYNDRYVDADDDYRHSKWLSFMSKRLRIAKRLLSDRGVIFISIDDNEQANLKLLCDEVFGEKNFLSDIIWNSTKSVTNTAVISVAHTHNFVYFHNINYIVEHRTKFRIPEPGEGFDNPDNDPRGPWKADPFQVGGWRPNQQYEIVNPTTGVTYKPNKGCSWKNDYNNYLRLLADNRIVFGRNGTSGPQRKRFLWEAEERGRVVKTIWDDVETTTNGTQQLKIIFAGESPFTNPKPIMLIERFLQLGADPDSTILDFFAGSGTTMHAVMQLNKEDGGHRQCILVTNNENNICEEVTYKRNRRVIEGYTTPKGVEVEGLKDNSLRYYRTRLLPRQRTNRNMRDLMAAATDLLCIKEDIFDELEIKNLAIRNIRRHVRLFGKGSQYMLIIYNEEAIPRIVQWIAKSDFLPKEPIKIYTFSYTNYAYDDDFAEVEERVQLCALPAAIYEAYRRVLPQEDRYYDNESIDGKEDNQ